jgi:hypothetical protein
MNDSSDTVSEPMRLWKAANDAKERGNLLEAIELFHQILAKHPDHRVTLDAIRFLLDPAASSNDAETQ